MPNPTPELGLQKAQDADDTADYLTIDLAPSLTTIDSLFNNVTGHTHGGVHQGGPIGSIPASAIPDGSITSAKISDGSIAAIDLADGAVTTTKLADASVTSAKISDGTIVSADLAAGAVNTAQLADSSVTSAKIADGTIQGADIAGGAVSTAQIAASVTLSSPTLDTPTVNTPTENNPTLVGTVSGAPTWASAQSFPAGERVGGALSVANANTGDTNWRIQGGSTGVLSAPTGGSVFTIGFPVGFNANPILVANVQGVSGGQNTAHVTWWTGNVGPGSFQLFVNNGSGGGQSLECSWFAFGR